MRWGGRETGGERGRQVWKEERGGWEEGGREGGREGGGGVGADR